MGTSPSGLGGRTNSSQRCHTELGDTSIVVHEVQVLNSFEFHHSHILLLIAILLSPCFLFLPECILKAPKSQLLSVKHQAMASLWLESGFSVMMRTGLFSFLQAFTVSKYPRLHTTRHIRRLDVEAHLLVTCPLCLCPCTCLHSV